MGNLVGKPGLDLLEDLTASNNRKNNTTKIFTSTNLSYPYILPILRTKTSFVTGVFFTFIYVYVTFNVNVSQSYDASLQQQ